MRARHHQGKALESPGRLQLSPLPSPTAAATRKSLLPTSQSGFRSLAATVLVTVKTSYLAPQGRRDPPARFPERREGPALPGGPGWAGGGGNGPQVERGPPSRKHLEGSLEWARVPS